MNKRKFIAAALATGAALPASVMATPANTRRQTPTLLTVTGAIGAGNRGPLDPALDQMMKKQGVKFDKAHGFDFAALTALPSVAIRPTLEYDAKPHALRGPLLLDVVKAAGAAPRDDAQLLLRAIDGYAVAVTVAELKKHRFIVATHMDEHPMPLGGVGPLWAVYDADRFPDMAARPLNERFGSCPWGLYHIEVQ
ncbi:molybdopterin-dependent oxidoreductase [Noviherbaspirillum saxi]|uniref:Molybdopterin-dependent oxidoreductase n=1 Tax=Noviherbaspirillum saxi TaxID=2320863 RepID=A0A3A3FUD8_9BURK|nr:molybdopterin-dependent oxidoreductase [Noviherbaspirillum saxi]RJF99812.1 molybdopterin-dependent oxidoreductase [Noviherbaspirillum saxi]